ncbi:hypothetical protein [Sphingobacterium sp. 1.A.4]|uniref:hypothetical protein n=1 Tax=Sphingobacterium sp. 1.A.4 TaxID=2044603 RepID=UPI000C0C09DF|nr:hypothetical protein [Sphingobacterium sp. 1.A.4]
MTSCLRIFLFTVLVLPFFHLKAQDKSLIVKGVSKDEVFSKLKFYAIENDCFIQKLNRKEGMAQWQFFKEWKEFIFTKEERYTINLFVSPLNEKDSKIDLQIKQDPIHVSKDVYIDWKILTDGELYTDFIISLNQFFEQKK